MFELLRTSRSVSSFAMAPGAIVSLCVHGALVVALVAERRSHAGLENRWDRVIERLTYIAPPDVVSGERHAQIRFDVGGTTGVGVGSSNGAVGSASVRGHGATAGASHRLPLEVSTDAPAPNPSSEAYTVVEVEEIAERDPTSAAPAYPPHLLEQGVEGYATLRFVVDSSGRVDLLSIRVLDSTHAAFVSAVRDAIPGMRYRPARRGDRPVRQLAEQQFMFKIQPAQTARVP
jgi:TonB family protein